MFKILTKPKYEFSWYIYGPYSSELASNAFSLFEENKDRDDIEINTTGNKFESLNNIIDLFNENSIKWEMLASLHFLKTKDISYSKEQLFDKIANKRSYLNNRELFEECWKIVESVKNIF